MEILIQHLATVAQMKAVYPCFWVTLPSPDAERASSCNWLILEVRTRSGGVTAKKTLGERVASLTFLFPVQVHHDYDSN